MNPLHRYTEFSKAVLLWCEKKKYLTPEDSDRIVKLAEAWGLDKDGRLIDGCDEIDGTAGDDADQGRECTDEQGT